MSSQKKLSTLNIPEIEKEKMGMVLDLELKYFNILWDLFTSDAFIADLKIIESEIQRQYTFLSKTWDLKNKLKIPAERLTRQYIYKNLSNLVTHIYPSPISSDIAFITSDAIVNIDVKTLDIDGNRGDISNLQFESNQSSFNNKNLDEDVNIPNSGVKVECLLPAEYQYNNDIPKFMLTYFLTFIYEDNSTSFNLSKDNDLATIQLKCLPNGIISQLFDYDIVQNFKTYSYFQKKDGFEPIFLTDDINELEFKIEEFVKNNPEYVLINGRQKLGAYCDSQIHPYYKTKGISFFPVRRKKRTDPKAKYYLEAVRSGHTNRVINRTIIDRFDSSDVPWKGKKKFTLL